jgi:hypothetical protein
MPERIQLKSLGGRNLGKRERIKKCLLKVDAVSFSKTLVPF